MAAGIVAACACWTAGAWAQAQLEPIGSFSQPMHVTSDPSDPERLFVAQRAGTVLLVTPDGVSEFLDIPETVHTSGEQGLYSIAFPPDFATSDRFYVAYSGGESPTADHTVVDEYTAVGDVADPESRREVISIPTTSATNHNAGQLQFGPDGYLYLSTGESAVPALAQDLSSLLGKIIRIDPDQDGDEPYSVPEDNPFVDVPGARPEIWSLGLRNPWRFSFDRLTGALTIADVGAGTWEEVDHVPRSAGGGAGRNFGWPTCEGFQGPASCTTAFTPPVYAYESNNGPCAITGGYVVRDSGLGNLYGRYLFADLCASTMGSFDPLAPPAPDGHRPEGTTPSQPVSFGEDSCGRLYLATFGGDGEGNNVFRLVGDSGGVCPPQPPQPPDPDPDPPHGDTIPPQTTLEMRKPRRRAQRVFTFSSSEPDSTFECKRDRRPWRRCSPPRRLKHVSPGRHRFRVRAIDAAGNVDPTPAKRRFKIRPRR